jgi:hypothetical protein
MDNDKSASFIQVVGAAENLKLAVASFSLLGVGCAAGFYLAPAGFFEYQFKDDKFFLWMLMALYIPFPLVLLLQEQFDQRFDAMFGPRQTYFFRVIAVQMVLAVTFAAYSLASKSPALVLVCGAFIGFFSGATLSSTMQLMSVWDAYLAAWASVGKDIAGALPVITYLVFGFSASASKTSEFQAMQLFPIILISLCSIILTGLHSTGLWDKAYERLGYDVFDPDDEEQIRQVSETDPLLPSDEVDSSGAPLWTPNWQFATGFNTFLSFLLLPLVTSMRNPDLTQKLILGKLAMDCFARCAAALLSKTEVFGLARPNHYLLIALVSVRSILFLVLLAHLFHFALIPLTAFVWLWYFQYFSGSFAASQIDVTITRFAPVSLRKAISRRNTLCNFSGLNLGLASDVVIMILVL